MNSAFHKAIATSRPRPHARVFFLNPIIIIIFWNPIIIRNPIPIPIIFWRPKMAKIHQPMVYTSPGGVVAIKSLYKTLQS